MCDRVDQTLRFRRMGVVTSAAVQSLDRQSEVATRKGARGAGVAPQAGVSHRGHQEAWVLRGVRLVTLETTVAAGHRHMVGLRCELFAENSMTVGAQGRDRCA